MKPPVTYPNLEHLWVPSDKFDNCEELRYGHLDHYEWEQMRAAICRIGGSEVGGICGVVKSDYFDPNNRLLEKAAFIPASFEDTVLTAWGQDTEPTSVKWYQWYEEDQEGEKPSTRLLYNRRNNIIKNKVVSYPAMIRNRDFPWLVANIDGLITEHRYFNEEGIWEAKTGTGQYAQQHIGKIPTSHVYQAQTYMLITGLTYTELSQMLDQRQYFVHLFEPSEIIINHILEATYEFWQRIKKAEGIIANASNERQATIGLMEIMYDSASNLYQQFLTEKQKEREDLAEVDGDDEVLNLVVEFVKERDLRNKHNEREKELKNELRKRLYAKGIRKMKWPDSEPIKSVSFHKQLVPTINKDHEMWQ